MSQTDRDLAAVEAARAAREAASTEYDRANETLAKAVAKAIERGAPVVHVARAAGISRAQAYIWRDKYTAH